MFINRKIRSYLMFHKIIQLKQVKYYVVLFSLMRLIF